MADLTHLSEDRDHFADALDALTLGLPVTTSGDMSLVAAARAIGTISAPFDDDGTIAPVTLGLATKRRIWADLMREQGGAPEPSPVPQSPGAAGSTLSPNPWVSGPEAKPKRPRPVTGVLRFMPAAQPASTFILVIAVLALVGGAFASLAPNGGRGVFLSASATENPAQIAASPRPTSEDDPGLMIATPNASSQQWLWPLMNKNCNLSAEERAATPTLSPAVMTDPANYVPFTEADEADQVAAATSYLRVVSGCEAPGDDSLTAEGGVAVFGDASDVVTTQSQNDTALAITEELGYTDPIEILIANENPQMITDGAGIYTVHPSHVLFAEDVVQLPDGRLGGLTRVQVWSDPTNPFDLMNLDGGAVTLFVVFDRTDGGWALAESIPVFVGEGSDPQDTGDPPLDSPAASPASSPIAGPQGSGSASNELCLGQSPGMSDAELRGASMDDWAPPSYRYPWPAESEIQAAIHETYTHFLQCLVIPHVEPGAETPEEMSTYSSDRARFVKMRDDLSPDQQADIDAFTCLDREQRVLDAFPLPINVSARPLTIPTTNPPDPDWEQSFGPVYQLGDGRYGMVLGSVSSAVLQDPSLATDDDWLTFVAFVEVDGTYYIDEDFTVITRGAEDGTPVPLDSPTACTG